MDSRVVPVTMDHIEELAQTMQQEDVDSIWALTHMTPLQGLHHSIKFANESNTWLINGKVGAIYGVSRGTLLSETSCAWMLGSNHIVHYPRHVMEGSRDWINDVLSRHSILRNVVDARHKRSIRWLRWLGFTIYPAIPTGIEQLPFHPNELRKK